MNPGIQIIWQQLHSFDPQEEAFLFALDGTRLIKPIEFVRESWVVFEALSLAQRQGVYAALIPYEAYATGLESTRSPLCYRLALWEEYDLATGISQVRCDPTVRPQHRLAWRSPLPSLAPPRPVILKERDSEAHYLDLVRRIIADIRVGRYYQLNLLRFFAAQTRRSDLIDLMSRHCAPFLAWFQTEEQTIVSFSPERFICGQRMNAQQWQLDTFPIKGTASSDSATDLVTSAKDCAELNMIIDLMRNDLGEFSIDGSVCVPHGPRMRDFGYVRHLVGQVQSRLYAPEVTVRRLMEHTMPAGSITGAPKREVMGAIREYEQRQRGYVMGNLLFLDLERGQLDSSVLIRTVQSKGNGYEFAAGSGIVIKSEPDQELAEIKAKCGALVGNRRVHGSA